MAITPKYRLKQIPTDVWSIREKLCLASSVLRSGDQNWVSVSRAIKPYGEANRPPDWFSQKNCAIQYSDLLEKVETPKRKRGDRADVETPGNLIVRKLTIERIEELKRLINEEQQRHRKLRAEVDQVRSGSFDERLDEVWNRIQEETKLKAAAEAAHNKWLQEREARIAALKNAPKTLGKTKRMYPKQTRLDDVRRNSSQSEQSEQESALDSPLSEPLSIEYFAQVEDVSSPQPPASHADNVSSTTKATFPSVPVSTPAAVHGSQTSTSPLLTSLLKSPAPTTAISPTAGSLLTSPTTQPKEGTLPTTQASPRASTTPQPFFDPSCALATAAARQFAVATAPSPTPSSVESMFVRDRSQLVSQIENMDSHIHPPQGAPSATSSAPTLSKLLELPPGVPGKLPPLPVIQPEQTSSTLQTSTASTVTITTAAPASALVGTNVVSVITPETTIVNPTDDYPPSESLVTTSVAEDREQLLSNNFVSHHDGEVKVKEEPSSPISEVVEEETEVEIKPEITVKTEETGTVTDFSEGSLESKTETFDAKEGKEHEEEEVTLPEVIVEEEAKESCADVLSESERTEVEAVIEQQEVTTETETEGSPLETDSETMVETNAEELVPPKEDVTEGVEEDGKEVLSGEIQLPSVIEEQSEESRNEETVSDEQTSENQVITEDENILTTEEKKHTWEKPEVVEKEDLPTSPESVKPQEEETKISRKASSKRGRKPKIRPGKPQNAEESDESTRDKKDDDNSNASSLIDKDVTMKQADSSKHEKMKETPPATPKSELQQVECSEQSLVETKRKPTLSVSESVPNSPASTSQSDDQDTAKDYRTWKKAIMLVWNAAANHKFANTFLHPVTDDVAPGYHSIVYRPMDLSAIKKNIETGVIKTTLEFQRDMMLMFQNAVMYNSSDHDVFHMAVEMQKEVMEHIQDFLATQLMVQTADTKVLRGREREREKKSEGEKDDLKRKHPFTPDSESKSKKRRIRD